MKSIVVGAAAVGAVSLSIPELNDQDREQLIQLINKQPNMTWTAAHNPRFKGQAVGVSKSLCGVHHDSYLRMQKKVHSGNIVKVDAPKDFVVPDSFDSETNWPQCAKVIGDIRDQSNCGCCWAFGGASAASDRLCIATNGTIAVPISAEDVCFGASYDGCGGGYLDDTWEYVQDGAVTGGNQEDSGALGGGFCSKFSLPHCHHHGPQGNDPYPAEGAPGCPSESSPDSPSKCDSDAKAPYNDFNAKYSFKGQIESYSNEAAVAHAIMTSGPVESAFTVYGDFENYAGGIYQKTSSSVLGGHAIRIVGWGVDNGVKYWKVANSWNPYWGEKGYFRILRGQDECGIESQAMASGSDVTWSGPGL